LEPEKETWDKWPKGGKESLEWSREVVKGQEGVCSRREWALLTRVGGGMRLKRGPGNLATGTSAGRQHWASDWKRVSRED
jgi:hypothetical protein